VLPYNILLELKRTVFRVIRAYYYFGKSFYYLRLGFGGWCSCNYARLYAERTAFYV